LQIEALAYDGDEDIDRDGDPHLGFDRELLQLLVAWPRGSETLSSTMNGKNEEVADAIPSHARRYSRCFEVIMSGVKRARVRHCMLPQRERISRPYETNGAELIQGTLNFAKASISRRGSVFGKTSEFPGSTAQ
jgi:hypothetical protein